MFGSVDIAAIPPLFFVMEMCIFAMLAMNATANVIEDGGEERLCLPSMPFRALVKVVCIQNLTDLTPTTMENHWIANKFIIALAV